MNSSKTILIVLHVGKRRKEKALKQLVEGESKKVKSPLPETPTSYPNIRPPVAAIMHEITTIGVILASKSLPEPPAVAKPPPAMVVTDDEFSSDFTLLNRAQLCVTQRVEEEGRSRGTQQSVGVRKYL